ncbi:hypothetical protein Taro_040913 [Colocasia esculenta]|uniref:Uncharacterized protein n=1 Tax=Colocasia esculenta TaxID=4460 RepID=A0A843WD14_COLES|nr:hypothetical protein [Colocasia esculenta]
MTDWRVRPCEQIADWEHRGRRVRSNAESDDAYLKSFTLKYGRVELTRLRATQAGVSSSRAAVESSQSDLEDRLASALRRAKEAKTTLEEREFFLRVC